MNRAALRRYLCKKKGGWGEAFGADELAGSFCLCIGVQEQLHGWAMRAASSSSPICPLSLLPPSPLVHFCGHAYRKPWPAAN